MVPKNKTSRVELMTEMLDDDSVVFDDFIKAFKSNSDKIIFLLEGIDDIDYYLPIFDAEVGRQTNVWVDFVCNGRDNVINLVKILSEHTRQEYKDSLFFGFIDKDYHEVSDNIFKNKIYVTPTYSIENFYTTMSFFKNVLKRKFYLPENDSENNDFAFCCENFESRINEFISGIKELDMFLRCNRIMYEEAKIKSKINARDINLNSFVKISLNPVLFSSNALDVLGKKDSDFDPESLDKSINYYEGKSSVELSKVIRGKFMIFFIQQYLFRLKEDNIKSNPLFFPDSFKLSKIRGEGRRKFNKTRLTMNLGSQDLLADLCQLSDKPECLINFLSMVKRVSYKEETLVS